MIEGRGALAADAIERWADNAALGDQAVYAVGEPDIPRAAPGVKLVNRLVREKRVTTFARPVSDGRREYVMRCVARHQRAGQPVGQRSPAGIVLDQLKDAAAVGVPCPTNEELNEELACRGIRAPHAGYLFRTLAARGLIRVEYFGPGRRRRVTIVASGAITAEVRA